MPCPASQPAAQPGRSLTGPFQRDGDDGIGGLTRRRAALAVTCPSHDRGKLDTLIAV
jgi:hypothetical protein